MFTLQTRLRVDGLSAEEVFDFLTHPSDDTYRAWWPGTHLQLHPTKGRGDRPGDVIHMDEYVGERRLRMGAIVREAVPGRRLVWQMRKVLPLPARLVLDFTDDGGAVGITHTIEAGFAGPARILDPLVRLYFSGRFEAAMDEHARTEFPMLRDRREEIRAAAANRAGDVADDGEEA